MVFSSIFFILFFLPAFFLVYNLVTRKYKNLVFLAFSLLFYAWGAPNFIFILLGSTLANFFIVKKLYYTESRKYRKILAFLSIFLNLGLLAYFKYANFFMENFNSLLEGFEFESYHWTWIILPIGISFFTFQSLTYTVDVYRGIHAPLKNPLNYMLYILMFPQLVAGPIVRYETIADQLTNRSENNSDRLIGFYRLVIGLSKKVLIADVLGREVSTIMMSDLSLLDSSTAWIGILAYAFQIYFDFAGYSDMAIGIGRMVGFKFPENFDNPYTATSVTEFWRKWHMTFTTFMRYYLYYPLGGNKVKTQRRLFFNLFTVFLISGLWHGASWNFVIWGAMHGFLLIVERLFLLKFLNRIKTPFAILYTFIVVVLVWVPFRLEELSDSILYYQRLFAFNFAPINFALKNYVYVTLILALVFSMITLIRPGKKLHDRIYKTELTNEEHIGQFIFTIIILFVTIGSLAGWGFSPFIYFKF